MALIGSFRKTRCGYVGTIRTPVLGERRTRLQPTEKRLAEDPDYRVAAGGAEIGHAWRCTPAGGAEFLAVRLDDPTFRSPIYAVLSRFDGGKALKLRWSR